ncbi:MAG: disease resistance protein, partial [Roseimicrobium sp.]
MPRKTPKPKRFRIAFSFAGEKRDYVAKVAAILAKRFGEEAILYDKYHEARFARRKLGVVLPDLYHKESDLVVVVLCPEYNEKPWTGLEWTAIHSLFLGRDDERVMLSRFEHAMVEGLYGTAGFI